MFWGAMRRDYLSIVNPSFRSCQRGSQHLPPAEIGIACRLHKPEIFVPPPEALSACG
jgi:hypothetical protein